MQLCLSARAQRVSPPPVRLSACRGRLHISPPPHHPASTITPPAYTPTKLSSTPTSPQSSLLPSSLPLTRHFGMPPNPTPVSDARSSNARAHSAPAYHNTNRVSHVGSVNIGNQPQFLAPEPRGPPQTTPFSSRMGPPTMIPPSATGQAQGRSDIQARFDEIYFTSPLPRVSVCAPSLLLRPVFISPPNYSPP